MYSQPLSCKLESDHIVVNDDLRISFRRTVRVPDNDQVCYLPPDLGAYPLKPISNYIKKMPSEMTIKGGAFFPMYQSEAMWINFECNNTRDYMIKIYVGGINAVSGEPAVEDAGTKLRRQARLARDRQNPFGPSIQDYVVVPGQDWLDGIVDSNGTIVFNMQILNSAVYKEVTSEDPPTMPLDIKTYQQYGLPFYNMYDEPSGISGDFDMVKSIAQIDGNKEDIVTPHVVEITTTTTQHPVGLTNPNGPLREFRTVGDLKKEYSRYYSVDF